MEESAVQLGKEILERYASTYQVRREGPMVKRRDFPSILATQHFVTEMMRRWTTSLEYASAEPMPLSRSPYPRRPARHTVIGRPVEVRSPGTSMNDTAEDGDLKVLPDDVDDEISDREISAVTNPHTENETDYGRHLAARESPEGKNFASRASVAGREIGNSSTNNSEGHQVPGMAPFVWRRTETSDDGEHMEHRRGESWQLGTTKEVREPRDATKLSEVPRANEQRVSEKGGSDEVVVNRPREARVIATHVSVAPPEMQERKRLPTADTMTSPPNEDRARLEWPEESDEAERWASQEPSHLIAAETMIPRLIEAPENLDRPAEVGELRRSTSRRYASPAPPSHQVMSPMNNAIFAQEKSEDESIPESVHLIQPSRSVAPQTATVQSHRSTGTLEKPETPPELVALTNHTQEPAATNLEEITAEVIRQFAREMALEAERRGVVAWDF